MSDWATYSLSDFLLFSPRAYWRMFELDNEALWPLQVPAFAAGVVALMLVVLRPRNHGRWIALLLAALWAWVGWSFFFQRYATINWAAAYVAPIFLLQALLLIVAGWRGKPSFDRRGVAGFAGFALIALGLAGYPLLAPLFDRPWRGAELFGIAPDPTAIGTLGFLLLARGMSICLPIPLLWCAISGATLWALDAPDAWIAPAAALAALAAHAWPNAPAGRPSV